MNNSNPEERLVVTCPACETKFAVMRTALSQVDTPRFHCSRCDNVFVISVDELSPLEPVEPTPEAPEEPMPGKANPTSPMFPQPTMEEGPADMGYAQAKANETTELNDTREIKEALDKIPNEPQPIQDDYIAVPTTEPETFTQDDIPPPSDFGSEEAAQFPEQGDLFDDSDDDLDGYRDEDSIPDFPSDEPQIPRSHVATNQSAWRACIFISAPIACCLVALFALSFTIKQFPETLSAYVPSSIAAVPAIAPSGLYISDLRFKKMDLDSGENVAVIAGTLHNDTSEEYKNIVLEGLGFDEEGNSVSSVKIIAGAGLGNAKVKSLSREMINDLQMRPPIKKFSLPPQDTYSFSIALTSKKPTDLAHYSARVYSVLR